MEGEKMESEARLPVHISGYAPDTWANQCRETIQRFYWNLCKFSSLMYMASLRSAIVNINSIMRCSRRRHGALI